MAARWLKRIGLALVVVVLVVAGAVAAALLLVDTEALKNRIEHRVQAETGRELAIEGPLQISLFPWVGFELGPTRLANAPGFDAQDFLALEHAELRVRLVPLLQREIVLDTVVLRGARVNAARNAAGETNWADLVGGGSAPAPDDQPPGEPTGEPAAPAESGAPLRLRVAGIDLRDARVSWTDAQNGRRFVLEELDLTTGALASDRPTPVQLDGTLRVDGLFTLGIQTRARVRYDQAAQTGAVEGLMVELVAQGPGIPSGSTARLDADARFDLAAGSATVDPFTLELLGTVSGEGDVQVRFAEAPPSLTGRIAASSFSPAELAEAAGVALPPRADEDTLQQASLSATVQGTPEQFTVEPLQARLDDTRLSGRTHARLTDKPYYEATLDADGIDLDRYLPPEDSDGEQDTDGQETEAGTDAAGDPIADLPTELLRAFDGQARISVGELGWRGLQMNQVRLEARLADGVLELDRADMGVAEGRISATGQLDGRNAASPAGRIDAELADLQSEPLLAAFVDTAAVTGRVNAQAQLAGAGGTLDAWLRSLDGELGAVFRDGGIRGINIAQRLRVVAARLRGDELTQASETRSTDFSSLSISATIREGIVRSDDLDLRAPLLRASGEGRVNLPEQSLDYTARVRVTGTLEGQGGGTGPDLRGVEVPVHLTGPLNSPQIDLAVAEGLRQRVREDADQEADEAEQRARDEIEREVDETRDRLERELREGMEGLFE